MGVVWLLLPGPPPVSTQMVVNTASVCSVISMRLVTMVLRIIGRVTNHSRFKPDAPSIDAASWISGEMSESAALYTIIEKAVPRQTLARMTANIGAVYSQS